MSAIRFDQVTKEYSDGVKAVAGVSLEIQSGEFTALVGPSGSGKTTLLCMAAGLDRPTSGSVSINGTRIDQLSYEELCRLRRSTMGFVFQSYQLFPFLTVAENAEYV